MLGFIPFILMLYHIWKHYCHSSNINVFIAFTIIWSMYGIVYFFNKAQSSKKVVGAPSVSSFFVLLRIVTFLFFFSWSMRPSVQTRC